MHQGNHTHCAATHAGHPSALAPVVLAFYFPKLYFSPGLIPLASVNSKLVTCSWTPAMQSGDASVNTHEGYQTCSSSRPGLRLPSQAPSEAIKTATASKQPKGAHALCPLKIALSIRCSHHPTEDGTMSPCQAEMDSWAGPDRVSQHTSCSPLKDSHHKVIMPRPGHDSGVPHITRRHSTCLPWWTLK